VAGCICGLFCGTGGFGCGGELGRCDDVVDGATVWLRGEGRPRGDLLASSTTFSGVITTSDGSEFDFPWRWGVGDV